MILLAIDPGPEQSAFVELYGGDPARTGRFGKFPNAELLNTIAFERAASDWVLAIEMIASYGMPVGREVFDTCVWIGRFIQAWTGAHAMVYRKDVKLAFCGSARANDATIRQAIIDRYGGKERAIGRKAKPGPLHGIHGDVWSALAVGLYYLDTAPAREKGWVA